MLERHSIIILFLTGSTIIGMYRSKERLLRQLTIIKNENGGYIQGILGNSICRGYRGYLGHCTSMADFELNGKKYHDFHVASTNEYYGPTAPENRFQMQSVIAMKNSYFEAIIEEVNNYIPQETDMEIVNVLDQR